MPNMRTAVIGSGSWGTALVKLLQEGGHTVHWWMRHDADVAHVQAHHHNPSYLSDVVLDAALVRPSSDLQAVVEAADVLFLVVPAAFVGGVLAQLDAAALAGKTIISGIKGIVPGENLLITDYLERHLGCLPDQLAIIAGPCHAEEVALEKQSYLTIGATSHDTAARVGALLAGRYVKASPSPDLYGLEYCAILKNIVAIGCGIAHGLRYGDNFLAVLVSNALLEIEHFLDSACPLPGRRISASGYGGDVLVTSYSQFSRNRTFGAMLGRGYSVQSAQVEMNMVAEGYYASKCIHQLNATWQADMPVIEAVYRILYERAPAAATFAELAEGMV